MTTKRNLAKTALEQEVEKAMFLRHCHRDHNLEKPGQLIQSLGPIKRHILEDLKSDDIKDVRWPPFL